LVIRHLVFGKKVFIAAATMSKGGDDNS